MKSKLEETMEDIPWRVAGSMAEGALIGAWIGCVFGLIVLVSMLIWPECILFRPIDW